MLVFIWLLIITLLLHGFWKYRRPSQFPPGPWILPFFGNVLQIDIRDILKTLDQFGKKYGPVFSWFIGGRPIITVHGFLAAKEVLVTKGTEFADRADNDIVDSIHKKKGIITACYGEVWKAQRRFALTILRNFGLGKRSIEERILEEAGYLIQDFAENKGGPFDPLGVVSSAVSNVISSLIFGKRYEYSNQSLRNTLDLLQQNMKMIVGPWAWLYNTVPIIRGLPLPHQKIFKNAEKIFAFFRNEVEEHKATLVPGNPRDFIDAYLEEIQKVQLQNESSSFDEENLIITVLDLFAAGSETTTDTVQWCLLYMMAFPDIQEKCQREIDSVLGNAACVEYEDRERLPYTNAVIHEIQRMSGVVSLSINHAPLRDTLLLGYRIPKGTLILINIASVLFDESQWKYPHEFNPSNFLNENGEFMKPEAFLAFSTGPRACLGENLARMEIFLFFTSVLRSFKIVWPDESSAPDLTPQFGVTMAPSRFKMLLKSR